MYVMYRILCDLQIFSENVDVSTYQSDRPLKKCNVYEVALEHVYGATKMADVKEGTNKCNV